MAPFLTVFYLSTIIAFCLAADHCTFNGKTYAKNQQFNPTPCQVCLCSPFASVACSAVDCPPVRCVDSIQKNGECCRTCPNGPNCMHGNHLIKDGELYRLPNGDVCECPLVHGDSHGTYTKAICGQS